MRAGTGFYPAKHADCRRRLKADPLASSPKRRRRPSSATASVPGHLGVRRFVACLSGYSLGTLPDSMKASRADCCSRTYLPSFT